ncbi:peptidylprolyl isomerase [Crocosphaera chwakensis]|uniref:Peptidyl-prolyl cis-trans isomerase n=1 Tax=Crocosphaera chwakensis CCY0110 TaxID=391612 RepID=A3IV81_9CHRO|nr:peptidylprolyl isomerase [Crocosphaera chwakensis]EAZ89642.1 peptidyl-prolyl cis-trans isomerase B [Crocosphaera chwakensis CCY0110]
MRNLKKRWLTTLACLILVSGFMISGCSNTDSNSETVVSPNENQQVSQLNMDNYPRLEGNAVVEMTINGSPVTIEVKGEDAPITAGNFVDLVQRGFYDGLTFHRVVKDPQPFVAQGGDPQGTGMGGFVDPETKQERRIPLEIKLEEDEKPTYSKALGQQGNRTAMSQPVILKHERGAVAMARSGMPDSASSQFYFALSDLEFLNGDYAVFGEVTEGMDVVDSIQQGDRIDSAKVVSGLENLKK